MENVVWFSEVGRHDVGIVGGKGANLGELYSIGAPVPNGFIITANCYFENVLSSGALDRIKGILFGLDVENPTDLASRALKCQDEIKKIKLNNATLAKIGSFYKKLGKKPLVAVRSSATAEDLPEASFAGQQATFLNIRGEKNLTDAVLAAWASLFEPRAIFYRVQKNFDHFKVGIAIPVQLMVESDSSGVMFTLDPITNDKRKIIIEAIYGLGELIVQGAETPDHYEVSKKDYSILTKTLSAQNQQLVKRGDKNKLLKISKNFQKEQKLPDEKIIELAKIGVKIEKHYFFPQDIEWAYQDGKLFIVQTRPVTTIAKELPKKEEKNIFSQKKILLQGAPASPTIGTGHVVIIHSPKEISKVKKGDVLVTEMTNPDFVPAMKRANAIVTDRGGRTSHAAIVSRELGIACVVGAEKATKTLKNGQIVTVNGKTGIVYEGSLQQKSKELERDNVKHANKIRNTATHLYVNLAEPSLAHQVAARDVDGVGLLRAEFMYAEIGTHPKKFIEDKNENAFIEKFSSMLSVFGKAFGQRTVIYRASDFKSNEYRNLKGGQKYEPIESNPMLGYRGAFRYIKDPDTFKLELQAIKLARKNHKNLQLMVPFVRNVNELVAVRKIVEEIGLFNDKSFELYMMVEIPVNIILLDQFIDVGINGISIGSNDLTMLILGTDRDNEEVATEFYELNEAVLWALEKAVKTAVKRKIKVSICGQAPSVYPDLAKKLVSWGISSISVNPDVLEQTRELIYQAEKDIL
ncbi:phosphoenolpyruvate synthase [Candidatus Curtissbacteria bacterium]|nr:phosphoenolpyruvate synthase [Candidatus Curtissbacteria bacterium]